MLGNLQLRPLMIADLSLENKFMFSQYFSLRMITTFLAIGACLFLIKWSDKVSAVIFLLVISLKASESISDIIYAYYNARKEVFFIGKSLAIKSFLIISLSFFILNYTGNIVYSLAATFIGYFLVLVFFDLSRVKNNLKSFSIFDEGLKKIIINGMPLGIAVMLISLQANIPKYFLEHYFNVELVGVYTIFYYFIIVGGIVISSVCQYLSPYFSESYRDSNLYELKRAIFNVMLIALILGVLGLAITLPLHGFIIKSIYGSNYIGYSYLLPYMMLAGLFTYFSIVSGYLLTSLNLLKIQMPIFIFLMALTFLFSYWLIPTYGLLGAVYTTMLSAFSQFLISSLIVYNKIKELASDV
jgi:O-antigen/teichoic acid export membrane protein